MGLLCYYGGTIIDTNNGITYEGGSNEFFSLRLDSLFGELKNLVYECFGWNLSKIKVDIT
jgi:hypothetical protein